MGWIKLTKAQAQEALNNSVKVFTVFDDDKPIGMGRVIGDKGSYKLYSGFDSDTGISGKHIGVNL